MPDDLLFDILCDGIERKAQRRIVLQYVMIKLS
jgi:hypothetical protein